MNGQKMFKEIIENLKEKYSEFFSEDYKEQINVSLDQEIEQQLQKYQQQLQKILETAIKTMTETDHLTTNQKVIEIKFNENEELELPELSKVLNNISVKLEKQDTDYYDDIFQQKSLTVVIPGIAKIQINGEEEKIKEIHIEQHCVDDKYYVTRFMELILQSVLDTVSELYLLESVYEKKSITKPPTIITHDGLAHVDDLLAVALLLTKYPDTTVIRKSEVTEEELNDDMTIVVDVGGRYEPENRNYDHHQDKELPSSLIMVLKYEFGRGTEEDLLKIDELRYIDTWDRFGPVETQKRFDIKLPEFRELVSDLVLRAFSKAKVISRRENIELYFTLLTLGKELLEFIDNYRKLLNEVKENSEVKEVKGLKVVKINKPIQIKYIKKVHPDVAIVVQPNPRTKGAYSVIRIDDHPRVDFNRIKDQIPAHFIHPTGFMAVVDPEYVEQAINISIL